MVVNFKLNQNIPNIQWIVENLHCLTPPARLSGTSVAPLPWSRSAGGR